MHYVLSFTIKLKTMLRKTYRTQVIEVSITAGTGNTKFPDQPQLNNAIIFGIEAFTTNDISVSPLTGSALITLADFKIANLLLVDGSVNKGQNIPLVRLHEMQNAATDPFTRHPFRWCNLVVSWTKCYVVAYSNFASTGVLPLEVEYAYPEDLGFSSINAYLNSLKFSSN